MVSGTIKSDTFIYDTCQIKIYEKNNGETLQSQEIRDGHSIALRNILTFFNSGVGSTLQESYTRDFFASDNAFKAKHMIHVSGGSYQAINVGSTFFVLITCGSLTPSDFAINGCHAYKYAQGSYLLYGPDGPSLGSSRARVMKTLFYGTNGTNPRAGSEFISQLGSISINTNSFGDWGRRAYTMTLTASKATGAFDTTIFNGDALGSFEASSGSIWNWSYVSAQSNSGAGISATSIWGIPQGTVKNTATLTTSDETGLDLVADVEVSPGSASLQIQIQSSSGVGESASGEGRAFFLTSGSFVGFTYSLLGMDAQGSTIRDFMGSGVPKFGSITDTTILDYTHCWVQFSPIAGVNGSVDSVIVKSLGSLSSDTIRYISACVDGGSNFTYMCDGTLGSVGPNTGSLIGRFEIYRNGSTQRDYTNGYGVYYG